jgi:hypothetical protein
LNPSRASIYQVHNGVLTPGSFLLNSSGAISQLAVTQSGVVTFNGAGFTVNDVRTPQAIYRMDAGGTVTRVIDDSGPYSGIGNFASARNDATAPPLVFPSLTDNGGLVTGVYNGPDPLANKVVDSTGPFGPILAGSLQYLAADGTPRLIGKKPGTGTPVIYKGPDPQRDVVMDPSSFSGVLAYQENSRGDALFVGQLPGGVVGLYNGPDPVADRVVDSTSGLTPIAPFLNDVGQTVIYGAYNGTAGLFAGPDPVADRIISVGDPLFGSTLSRIRYQDRTENDLNNRGEFTFYYTLANGTTGVALVTVPEPAALAFICLAAPTLLRPRRR